MNKQIDQIKQQILEIARENRNLFVSMDLIHHASVLTASRIRLHEPVTTSQTSSVGSHQNESKMQNPSIEEKQSVQLFSEELESREGTMPEALMAVFLEDVDFLYMRSYRELNDVFQKDFQQSEAFKKMVLLMNENMIEYRFLTQAGLLKQ